MAFHRRLMLVTFVHGLFSSYGSMQAVIINFLQPVLAPFVNQSFYDHYGIALQQTQFSWLWSLIAALNFVGIVVGGICIAPSLETLGRRDTSMVLRNCVGILGLACTILSKPSNSWELLAMGHFLCGVALALQATLLLFIGECVPDKYRGFVTMMTGVSVQIWIVVASILALPAVFGNDWGWPYFACIAALPAIVHLTFTYFFPRSPKYLYINLQNKLQSLYAVEYYHGEDVDPNEVLSTYDKEAALGQNRHSVHRQTSVATFKMIWNTRHLRFPVLLVIVASLAPAFSGLPIRMQYSVAMLQSYGVPKEKTMIALIVLNTFFLPFNVLSPLLVEKFGRRPLQLSCVFCGFLSVMLMFSGELMNESEVHHAFSSIIGFAGFMIGTLSVVGGLILIPQLMIAELCPQSTRAIATAVAQIIAIFTMLLVVFTFLPMDTAVGAFSYLPMAICEILCFGFLYKYLPETKNLSVDVIVKKFMDHNERNNNQFDPELESEAESEIIPLLHTPQAYD